MTRQTPKAEPLNVRLSRRRLLSGLVAAAAPATYETIAPATAAANTILQTGADLLVANRFEPLRGKRIGLITNQTGRSGQHHLVDLLARDRTVQLAAILAPEHGFRGLAEAGAKVADGRDAATGIPIMSLYGATRAPTPAMLRDLDMLVFDIQDIGARFYTYISSMGLAMQAAARRGIPFMLLDRPNPLGGTHVSGFVMEPRLRSFVGQYPIPIVHGMTVGELAHMIRGERWLADVERVDLRILSVQGWRREMRFPQTGLAWVATSPNIPTFRAALVYPGIGIVGETLVNEGRGTALPFSQFGAPWIDAVQVAGRLNALALPGVTFAATGYVPRPIVNVAADPRFNGQRIGAVRIDVSDVDAVRPVEIGMHVLAALQREARRAAQPLLPGKAMFHAIAGTKRLHTMIERGATGGEVIGAWRRDVAAFSDRRAPYLLY